MIDDADFTDEQLLLTTIQAGKVLGVSRTTIYQLMKEGQLHAVHVARCCRISWAELERYVARLDAPHSDANPTSAATAVPTGRLWRRTSAGPGKHHIFPIEVPANPTDDSFA